MFWDFLSLTPESLHQVTVLFSDRGTPRRLPPHERLQQPHLQMVQRAGEYFWVEIPLQDRPGIKNLTRQQADELAGANPD